MNERIKELQGQTLDKYFSHTWTNMDYVDLSKFAEKFADLIVKDCLKEIKDMIVDESELLYPNNKQTTECVNDRLMDAHDNIAEYFGVE